jgi:hypothetical protein
MVTFAENLKSVVWVAAGSVANGVRTFAAPVQYRLNHRSLSSAIDIMAFGPKHLDYRRATAANGDVVAIKELDRVWIGCTPHDPTDVLAADANFYVFGNTPGVGGVAQLLFKKLGGDD